MSENIQSIANGSFVLGQTSAENPSLLVNENSEGNVSILQGTVATSAGIVGDGSTQNPLRADETVLWSGASAGISAGSFNENIFNFERFGVYWIMNNDGTYQSPTYQEFWVRPDTNYYLHIGFGNTYCYQGTINFSIASGGFSATKAQGIQITAWNAAASISTIDTPYLSKMRNGFTKVIGINRIANN